MIWAHCGAVSGSKLQGELCDDEALSVLRSVFGAIRTETVKQRGEERVRGGRRGRRKNRNRRKRLVRGSGAEFSASR